MKKELEEKKRLEQQRQRQKMRSMPSKKVIKSSSVDSTSTTSTASTHQENAALFFEENHKEEDSLPTQKKEKKKMRGEAHKGMAISQPFNEPPEATPQPLIHIENLTDNKNALKIFDKLFSLHPKGNCFDNEVQILLDEINTFFKALKQGYDPSKGKESHKKATLNFQDYGSDMEEQMIILTKANYLKEYQIKQTRETFIKARVIPDDEDIMAVLKKDFPDLMK